MLYRLFIYFVSSVSERAIFDFILRLWFTSVLAFHDITLLKFQFIFQLSMQKVWGFNVRKGGLVLFLSVCQEDYDKTTKTFP